MLNVLMSSACFQALEGQINWLVWDRGCEVTFYKRVENISLCNLTWLRVRTELASAHQEDWTGKIRKEVADVFMFKERAFVREDQHTLPFASDNLGQACALRW